MGFQVLRFQPNRRGKMVHRRSEEHKSELQSPCNLVCRLLLEKKKTMARARSATVITSEMRVTRFDAGGTVISVFVCSFPGSAQGFSGGLSRGMKSRCECARM